MPKRGETSQKKGHIQRNLPDNYRLPSDELCML